MLFSKKHFLPIVVLFLGLFILSGCSGQKIKEKTVDKLEWLDQEVGEKMEDSEKGGGSTSTSSPEGELQASDLTQKQKKKIDEWLEQRGLNRYGDSQEVIYPNGTPLYNKDKDKKIKRFNYILDRYPNVLERIKKNNKGGQTP